MHSSRFRQSADARDSEPTPHSPSHPDRARVREAILRDLPHEDRLLLVLWHAEQMSAEEIGAVLCKSEEEVNDAHERIVLQLSATIAPVKASA